MNRYDADESTDYADPPAAVPKLSEPPPPQLEQAKMPSLPSSVDNNQINQFDAMTEHHPSQNVEQRNGVAQQDLVQDSDGGAMNVEPESQGTGIKEDG